MTGFESLKDEELLLLGHMGIGEATSALLERYFSSRYVHAECALPGANRVLGPFDLNALFNTAFFKAMASFRFGKSRFQNYMEAIFARDIKKAMKERERDLHGKSAYSLEAPINGNDEEGRPFSLVDVLSLNEEETDPRHGLNYEEMVMNLKNVPLHIGDDVLRFIQFRMSGANLLQIARETGYTRAQVRRMLFASEQFGKEVWEDNHVVRPKGRAPFSLLHSKPILQKGRDLRKRKEKEAEAHMLSERGKKKARAAKRRLRVAAGLNALSCIFEENDEH